MKKNVMKYVASILLAFLCGTATNAQTIVLQGDVNMDGRVDVADIATVISAMASNQTEIKDHVPEGVDAIDLGLPSGTKWANMNLGAASPEDYGYYFAWGYTIKTEIGESLNWQNYKWMAENESTKEKINKYQVYDGMTAGCWFDAEDADHPFHGDNKAVLMLEDDAANHLWGGYWRMPTYENFVELITYCKSEWTEKDQNGVKVMGREFTSKINGNTVFFPAAGYRRNDSLESNEMYGYYWSATVYPTYTPNAYNLYVSSSNVRINDNPRYYGLCVRPVKKN